MRPWWMLAVFACHGPEDASGTGDTAAPSIYPADWDGVVQFLDDDCAQCHASGNPVLFPDGLEDDVRSGAGALVVAGDPDASALWRVISGDLGPTDFGPMPFGDDPLPAAEIAHVRAWIEAGAPLPPIDADDDGVLSDVDCDDADPAVTFGAVWHLDDDGDGFGAKVGAPACDAPSGGILDGTDCDDADDSAFPGGAEVCDGADDDCDGTVDDGASDAPTWFADTDGDKIGDVNNRVAACDLPIGYVADDSDCDDESASVAPGAPERCDSVDHDCDGAACAGR